MHLAGSIGKGIVMLALESWGVAHVHCTISGLLALETALGVSWCSSVPAISRVLDLDEEAVSIYPPLTAQCSTEVTFHAATLLSKLSSAARPFAHVVACC